LRKEEVKRDETPKAEKRVPAMKMQPVKPDNSSEQSFSEDTDLSGQIPTKFKPPKRLS
jgi:hypothetical protein